ncbi:MAG: hypothetical protein Q8R00_00545 [Candidatus Nanoarchaeia archaeon]|nr:hypothetical protein [Candidatus Nanoarchaeia archaeon]
MIIEFSIEHKRKREDREALINYMNKEYSAELVSVSHNGQTPILIKLLGFLPIPSALLNIFNEGAYEVFMECSKQIRKRCKSCGFPINKKDLIDRHRHGRKIDCRCCWDDLDDKGRLRK